MKQTRILMDMPVIVEIHDEDSAGEKIIEEVYDYFKYIDETFSVFKKNSEISKINRGETGQSDYSEDMKTIFRLAEDTKKQTNGYFDIIKPDGSCDPSGIVKGWAIWQAAQILIKKNIKNFYVEAGGDIQIGKETDEKEPWRIGIRNPFNVNENVKILKLWNEGVATSGNYIRGQHIYDPHEPKKIFDDIVSITVIGPNVYEADRFATAAYAMGKDGINFIEQQSGLEGYAIDRNGIATMTSDFKNYEL